MAEIIGSTDFLYIADCKAASLETRSIIDHELGRYQFPLPMTGDTPEILKEPVLNPLKKFGISFWRLRRDKRIKSVKSARALK